MDDFLAARAKSLVMRGLRKVRQSSGNVPVLGDCYVTMPDGTVLRKGQAEEMLTKKYQSRYQVEVK